MESDVAKAVLFAVMMCLGGAGHAERWHEYGSCLKARQVVRALFTQVQGPVVLDRGRCVKDVRSEAQSFDIILKWQSGQEIRLRAQNRRDSLEIFLDHQPALASNTPILGYTDCYSISIENGFEHQCFKGNNVIIEGISADLGAVPKQWQLNQY